MFEILSVCKGGGYRYCRTNPPHPKRNAKGLYPLHRVLMENKLGRLLGPNEDVHHKDEDKENNSVDNLEVKAKDEHSRHHRPGNPKDEYTCRCGKAFFMKKHVYAQRLARSKRGELFCSIACSRKIQITGGLVLLLGS
jgi:hypothetical protein